MEKIGLGGNALPGQCDVVRLVARRLGISCLIGKKKRGGRPFFMAVRFMTVRFYGRKIYDRKIL